MIFEVDSFSSVILVGMVVYKSFNWTIYVYSNYLIKRVNIQSWFTLMPNHLFKSLV